MARLAASGSSLPGYEAVFWGTSLVEITKGGRSMRIDYHGPVYARGGGHPMRAFLCVVLCGAMGCGGKGGTAGDADSDTDSGTDTGTADCLAPLTACGDACVYTDSDLANCGECGTACDGATPYCVEGVCAADCPFTDCDGVCADTEFNPLYCDTCDVACAAGEECRHGGCR